MDRTISAAYIPMHRQLYSILGYNFPAWPVRAGNSHSINENSGIGTSVDKNSPPHPLPTQMPVHATILTLLVSAQLALVPPPPHPPELPGLALLYFWEGNTTAGMLPWKMWRERVKDCQKLSAWKSTWIADQVRSEPKFSACKFPTNFRDSQVCACIAWTEPQPDSDLLAARVLLKVSSLPWQSQFWESSQLIARQRQKSMTARPPICDLMKPKGFLSILGLSCSRGASGGAGASLC